MPRRRSCTVATASTLQPHRTYRPMISFVYTFFNMPTQATSFALSGSGGAASPHARLRGGLRGGLRGEIKEERPVLPICTRLES